MTFQEFNDQLIFFLFFDFGYDRDQLRSLPRGYEPANESEKALIRDTNLRYFNRESDILLGNFMFANCFGFSPEDDGGEKSETAGETPGVPVRTFERLHLDALYDDFLRNSVCSSDVYAEHDDVECSWVVDVDSHLCNRSFNDLDVISFDLICNDSAINKECSAWFEIRQELVEGWSVHDHEVLQIVANRSSDRLV